MPASSATTANLPSIVTEPAMLREIGSLRIKAWKADGELPSFAKEPDIWLDEHDEHAINWAIIDHNKPIAAARLCVHERAEDLPDLESLAGFGNQFAPPIGSFNRLVVEPEFRGLGLSRLLDEVRMKAAFKQRCRSVVVTSHLQSRIHSLQRMGFVNIGQSEHRTVSYAPSFVFLRQIELMNRFDRFDLQSITIRRLDDPQEIAASQKLRYEVWEQEGAHIKDAEDRRIFDDHDVHAFHWGAFQEAKLIGSARLCIHRSALELPDTALFSDLSLPTPIASLNKLVIKRENRGQGLARQLDSIRIDFARRSGCACVVVGAVDMAHRTGALARRGFEFTRRYGNAVWASDVPITGTFFIFDSGDKSVI